MKDVYLQPDAPDPVLDEKLVLALARRHVPRADRILEVDESGGEARTYAVDEGLILKTQRPHRLRPRTSLRREVFFLHQLAGRPGIRVPRVLGYGREGAVEYTLMTRMPGVSAQHAQFPGAARTAALEDLGRMLRRIHAVDQGPFLASGLFPADPPEDGLRLRVQDGLEDILARLGQHPQRWALPNAPSAVAEQILAVLPDSPELRALHSNPGPTHTFIDEDGTLSGVIDFGDAFLGHPIHDLRRWGDPRDREAVKRGYLDEGDLGDEFERVWTALAMLTDMTYISIGHAASGPCLQDLSRRCAENS